ncbi:uncharacterized protein A4U43_C08F4920 [Asparagus officinalis]|nr:uncharacterized protein A4U43_C08F4920 [Asparagus officinalis]
MAPTSSSKEPSWAELLGSNHWANLLNPMDHYLGSWLSRWGKMAQVTYDAFNKNNSIFFASCRYTKEELLKKTDFPYDSDYKVTDLLYASVTTNLNKPIFPIPILPIPPSIARVTGSNFQGYVAVSSDKYAKETGRREICVAWRGTETMTEWINNLNFSQTPVNPLQSPPPELPQVMSYSWVSLAGVAEDDQRRAQGLVEN